MIQVIEVVRSPARIFARRFSKLDPSFFLAQRNVAFLPHLEQQAVDLTRCEASLGLGLLIGLRISNLRIHCTEYAADHELFAASVLFLQEDRRTQLTLV
jgi:hypothetical protein